MLFSRQLLRTDYRKNKVYRYNLDLTKAEKLLFLLAEKDNGLRAKPEFYNTLANTCLTNIIDP